LIKISEQGRKGPYKVNSFFDYYFRNQSLMENEEPLTGDYVEDHYWYFDISAFFKGHSYHVEIPEYSFQSERDSSHLKNLIYRVVGKEN